MTTDTPTPTCRQMPSTADGNDIFESNHGVRFLSSPRGQVRERPGAHAGGNRAGLPQRRAEHRMHAYSSSARCRRRQLWLGRLPPTRPGDGVRIPGICVRALHPHRPAATPRQPRSTCASTISPGTPTRPSAASTGWRRKNDRWVQRAIPDGAKPLSDPATTARFFLETQFPALMKLGTAIAHFDSVFAEVAAATEIAKDVRVWNPESQVLPRPLRRNTLDPLRRAGVPKARSAATSADAPQRFDLIDPGTCCPPARATQRASPKPPPRQPPTDRARRQQNHCSAVPA